MQFDSHYFVLNKRFPITQLNSENIISINGKENYILKLNILKNRCEMLMITRDTQTIISNYIL